MSLHIRVPVPYRMSSLGVSIVEYLTRCRTSPAMQLIRHHACCDILYHMPLRVKTRASLRHLLNAQAQTIPSEPRQFRQFLQP
jgi:hypothetical protein